MKALKRKSLLIIILTVMLAVFSIAGLNSLYPKAAQASVDAPEFSIYGGVSLGVPKITTDPSGNKIYGTGAFRARTMVNVTSDIYTKLNSVNANGKCDYYLVLTRVKDAAKYTASGDIEINESEGESRTYYCVDNSKSMLSSEEFKVITYKGENYISLPFNFPADTEAQYTYFAQFMRYEKSYKTVKVPFKIGLIPIYIDVKKPVYTKVFLSKTSNKIERSVQYIAEKVLENESDKYSNTEEYPYVLDYFKELAGVTTQTATFPVRLVYKKCTDYNTIRTETHESIFNVSSTYVFAADIVFEKVKYMLGITDISYFDAVFKDITYYENADGEDIMATTEQRIMRGAKSYEYTYDKNANAGTLTITYNDFAWENFAIQIKNNDPANALTLYAFPSARTVNEDGSQTLRFNYSNIQNLFYSSAQWSFILNKTSFNYNASTPSGINITPGDNELTVTVNGDAETVNLLSTQKISATAEIIQDFDARVTLDYAALKFEDGTIKESTVHASETMKYTEYLTLIDSAGNFSNFRKKYGATVNAALSVPELEGATFYQFNGVDGKTTGTEDNYEFNISVKYRYNTLVQLDYVTKDGATVNAEGVAFLPLTSNSLTYQVNTFPVFSKFEGYRLAEFTSKNAELASIDFNAHDPMAATFTINCATSSTETPMLIPFNAVFSNKWFVNVTWFERYKNTPFATMKNETFEVKAADYDFNNLTRTDVEEITGITDMTLLSSAPDKKQKLVTFDNKSTYTIEVTYGFASVKVVPSQGGEISELKVPLTNYAAWCDSFDYMRDWSIMMLNTSEQMYFRYSNEIERDEIYGYFSVATFQEKMSNISSIFAKNSGCGTVVLNTAREVKGSAFYKVCNKLAGFNNAREAIFGFFIKPFACVPILAGQVADAINDENGIYYSHFFYIDQFGTVSSINRTGATDPESNESSSDIFFDTTAAKIKSFFSNAAENVSKWFNNSTTGKILKWFLIIAGCAIVSLLIIKIAKKLFG